MKIVIASDSFKGSLISMEVAESVEKGILDVFPSCEVVKLAVADGGEGTTDALCQTLGGETVEILVEDPLGRPVKASYAVLDDGHTAVLEMSAASGLTLLAADERNPMRTSTYGTGQLIADALARGCRKFLVGIGGSATNDGGMGMVGVPGFLEKTRGVEFTVACDVDTPYIGKNGASRVFGPQKGASAQDVEVLEERLRGYALKIMEDTGIDVSNMAGAGAAGGLGGAFRAYLGAELKRGVDLVLDQIDFDSAIEGADLVITGEGCSDYQTLKGKTASGVLERAERARVPVALVSGAVKDEQMLRDGGFQIIAAVSPHDMPLEEAMRPETAEHNIYETVKRLLTNE